MCSSDLLGAARERATDPLPPAYLQAFHAIEADPNQYLAIALLDGEPAGMLQLSFIPYLTYQGGWRALIEGVRIAARHRDAGLGRQLMAWAIDQARARGCHLVQLTTDKARPDALRFYESLGFRASHEGLKLHLDRR